MSDDEDNYDEALDTDEPETPPTPPVVDKSKSCLVKPSRLSLDNMIDSKLDKDTGNSLFMIASSKCGKTSLFKKLISKMKKHDNRLIPLLFAGNPNAPCYKDCRDELPIFNGLKPSLIMALKEINDRVENSYRFLIIVDDIITSRYQNVLQSLGCSFRNSNISSIFCIQSATMIHKNGRSSGHGYFFSGRTRKKEMLFILHEWLKNLDEFDNIKNIDKKCEYMQSLSDNYDWLAYFPNDDPNKLHLINAMD